MNKQKSPLLTPYAFLFLHHQYSLPTFIYSVTTIYWSASFLLGMHLYKVTMVEEAPTFPVSALLSCNTDSPLTSHVTALFLSTLTVWLSSLYFVWLMLPFCTWHWVNKGRPVGKHECCKPKDPASSTALITEVTVRERIHRLGWLRNIYQAKSRESYSYVLKSSTITRIDDHIRNCIPKSSRCWNETLGKLWSSNTL